MPGHGGRPPHATNAFVWTEWNDPGLGYPEGFVFVAGMLNGAFSVGTPDCVTHLAEEIPRPGVNVPKAIAMQMVLGFFTGWLYLIAILYSINDYAALATSPFVSLPLPPHPSLLCFLCPALHRYNHIEDYP